MSKSKTPTPAAKPPRKQQWIDNGIRRRKAIVAGGGRVLPVLLEKEHSEALNRLIALRKQYEPGITMTGWVKRMIASDLKQLLRRRVAPADDRSTTP